MSRSDGLAPSPRNPSAPSLPLPNTGNGISMDINNHPPGFQVALVASMVSAIIILLMSVAFISCCLADCVAERERKKRQSLKERNYNNDNSSSRDNRGRPLDHKHVCGSDDCRCPQNVVHGPVYTPEWHSLLTAAPANAYNHHPLPEQNLQLHPQQHQNQYQYPGPSAPFGLTPPTAPPGPEVEQRWEGLQNLLSAEEILIMRSLDPAEEFSFGLMSV